MKKRKSEIRREEQTTIHEKLVPKKKNIKQHLLSVARILLVAVLFGCVFGAVVAMTEKFLMKNWGVDRSPYQLLYAKDKNKGEGKTTPTPVKENGTGKDSQAEPSVEPQITVAVGNGAGQGNGLGDNTDLQGVQEYYAGIVELAREAEKSIVRVQAVAEGVDWFGEPYEIRKNATGLYVGDNETELLFLFGLDGLADVEKFEVTLKGGTVVPGKIYSRDTNYQIGIFSVKKSDIEEAGEKELPVKAVFSSKKIESGVPVIVLGNVNQHTDAIEIGMVTSADGKVHIMDDAVSYFTTNIVKYTESNGFIFDMAGKPIGLLSASLCNKEAGIFSAASLENLRSQVERILNKKARACCGVRIVALEEEERTQYGISGGVYVTEVFTGSPAFSAGLAIGDIIIKVEKNPVTSVEGFHRAINATSEEKSYSITVSRMVSGERKTQEIQIAPDWREY